MSNTTSWDNYKAILDHMNDTQLLEAIHTLHSAWESYMGGVREIIMGLPRTYDEATQTHMDDTLWLLSQLRQLEQHAIDVLMRAAGARRIQWLTACAMEEEHNER